MVGDPGVTEPALGDGSGADEPCEGPDSLPLQANHPATSGKATTPIARRMFQRRICTPPLVCQNVQLLQSLRVAIAYVKPPAGWLLTCRRKWLGQAGRPVVLYRLGTMAELRVYGRLVTWEMEDMDHVPGPMAEKPLGRWGGNGH